MRVVTSSFTVICVALASPALAGPADVNADSFYRDARALMAKGVGAMFDKRTKPMMASMKAAGTAAREENRVAIERGKPLYCVPEATRKKGMRPEDVVDKIGRVPVEQRRAMTLGQAWRAALIRDYPCR